MKSAEKVLAKILHLMAGAAFIFINLASAETLTRGVWGKSATRADLADKSHFNQLGGAEGPPRIRTKCGTGINQ